MSQKFVVFSTQCFLIKAVLGQCIGSIANSYGIGNYEGFVGKSHGLLTPCECASAQSLAFPDCGIVDASYGGTLNVHASSPIAPGRISVQSANHIQGPLSVYGTLPFLSAVAFEGLLPTHGSGTANYQCGDGSVVILEENIPASGYDNFATGSFGAGWGLATSAIKGINNCVESVPSAFGHVGVYGLNWNKGIKCGCGY